MTPFPTIGANQNVIRSNQHVVNNDSTDYQNLRPFFDWVNVDTAQKTIKQSTQWGVSIPNTFYREKYFKRHEPVATETIFSDRPAVESGAEQAQVFVGRDTFVADDYPMKSGKQFVNTFQDNIRMR